MKERISDGQRWGRWVYRQETNILAIEHPTGPAVYDIDLDRCGGQVEILDWIFHVSKKVWVTEEDLGHLVRALQACLMDLPRIPEDTRGSN